MAETTVKQLAETVGTPVERLISQLEGAGLSAKGPDDIISEEEKLKLLTHLRKSHGKGGKLGGGAPKKLSLRKKSVSELKVGSGAGRAKTVSVEVRKKRTFVKPPVEEVAEAAPVAEEPVETAPVAEAAPAPVEAEAAAPVATEQPISEEDKAAEEARLKAEEEAARKAAEEAARKAQEEEARRLAQEKAHQEMVETQRKLVENEA
ncbi:MAG: translation initiation factor IF-2 associated domain-containing protein, partial [Gammaproteobacteria bacterium]